MDEVWTKIISTDERRPDETLRDIHGDKRSISDWNALVFYPG